MHNITNTKQHLDPKSCRQLQWPNEYNIPSLKALHPMTTPCPPFLSKCVPHKTPTTSTKHKKLPITKKHKMMLDQITRTITHIIKNSKKNQANSKA
jgi:hypothetical protein